MHKFVTSFRMLYELYATGRGNWVRARQVGMSDACVFMDRYGVVLIDGTGFMRRIVAYPSEAEQMKLKSVSNEKAVERKTL